MQRFERAYAEDEWYSHLYRTHAYHGVHPFYMWYWGAHALDHVGDVIFVGGDKQAATDGLQARPRRCRTRWRWRRATVGRDPSITHFGCPPLFYAEVE